MSLLRTVVAVLAAANGATAFFRMQCPMPVGVAQVDPLVDFDKPSKHSHLIFGANSLTATSKTTADMRQKGACTTCLVPEDLSAYWTPTMYFFDEEAGEYTWVEPVGGLLAYYFFGEPGTPDVETFPENHRMVVGDPDKKKFKTYDPTKADLPLGEWKAKGIDENNQEALLERAIGFHCMFEGDQQEGSLERHIMPSKEFIDKKCNHGMRIEIMFPQCWNGKPFDLKNPGAHMAYPSLQKGGDCPKSHPRRLPQLFYETHYDTVPFAKKKGKFLYSTGDQAGYSYHADFINGWDRDVLKRAIKECTNQSGQLSDCPVFKSTLQDQNKMGKCEMKLEGEYAKDNKKPGKVLPGGLKIWPDPKAYGPELTASTGAKPASSSVRLDAAAILAAAADGDSFLTKSGRPVENQNNNDNNNNSGNSTAGQSNDRDNDRDSESDSDDDYPSRASMTQMQGLLVSLSSALLSIPAFLM